MINLSFIVNEGGINYFKSKLNKKTNYESCIIQAQDFCNELNSIWENLKQDINGLFCFLVKNDIDIKVDVYPKYFNLGAINTEKGIIVLGQPSRSKYFYAGLFSHELTHFILKDINLNRFIEEIICFMFERKFIYDKEGVDIDDFDYEKGTDAFHMHAIKFSKQYYDSFLMFILNLDLNGLLNFLDKNVSCEYKNIDIEHNLINYLQING